MAVIMRDKVSVRGPAYFIQGDTQTQIVCFSVARYRDGVDLAQLAWSVHIKNAAGQEDVAVPHEQPDVRTDKININWLVKGVATAAAGYMTFCLRGVGTDPEGEPLRWSSGDDTREVRAAQESEASGEQADKLSELDALIEYVAKELPAVVQAGTEAKQAAADAEAAALATREAIDRANRLAALPGIGDPGNQGKVLTVGKGEGDAPQWILSSQIDDAAVSVESTWSSKHTVERFLPEFSESGAAVECHPFPLCPLNVSTTFEPAQAGSGDPYPAGGGRNLISFQNLRGYNNTFFSTAVIDGQSVTTMDVSTSDYEWASCGTSSIRLPAAGTYTFSAYVYAPTAATCRLSILNSTYAGVASAEQKLSAGWTRLHVVFAYASANDEYMFIVRALTSENVDISFNRCMVELGDVPTEYQSYSNIRPISGYDSLEFTRCGKNLLQTKDHNADEYGLKCECTDGLWHVYGTVDRVYPRCQMPIPLILPAGSYICIPQFVSGSLSDVSGRVACVTFDTSKYIRNVPTEIFESTRFDVIIFGNIPIGTTVDVKFYLMVVLASETDMTYEPYRGDTYIVHLGDAVYGGTYDWSKGELVAEWATVAFDGTENVEINDTESQTYMRYNYYRINLGTNNALVALGKCSHFKTRDNITVPGDTLKNTFEIHGMNFYPIFRVDRTKWPTANDWKAFLAAQYAAGTPVQIAYKLAEPITIQLAPLEIMPLEGMNVLISNPGNTTVSSKLDPIYLHVEHKAAAAKLAGMETRLRALESAAVNNA